MRFEDALNLLKEKSDQSDLAGMAHFGISVDNAIGVRIPEIRRIAKLAGKDHKLAIELWKSGIHEARILASCVDEPQKVTPDQCDNMVNDFRSWDLCDQVCKNLFKHLDFIETKIDKWRKSENEFVKRAAFSMICELAVHWKNLDNKRFEKFLGFALDAADDKQNFVRKAVNWSIRQIGKRNMYLNSKALDSARIISLMPHKSSKWIASNAIRELNTEMQSKDEKDKEYFERCFDGNVRGAI